MHGSRALLLAAVAATTAITAATLGLGRPAGAAAPLIAGWNNVTYTGSSAPTQDALSSLDGKFASAYRWDADAQEYDAFAPGAPAVFNTLDRLNPGDTIWLDVTAESAELATTFGGRLSIAASTFQPASDLAIYEKSYNELHPVGTDEHSTQYFAPVALPDGATVTQLTAHYAASGGEVKVRLDYTPLSNGTDAAKVFKLAEVSSSAGSSPRTAQAFNHTVDNAENVYFLIVDLTGGPGTKLRGVTISYTGG